MAALTKLTTNINLEMSGDTKRYLVSAKQGDKATRFIVARLLNNGEPYTIPTGARAVINIAKPDGKYQCTRCSALRSSDWNQHWPEDLPNARPDSEQEKQPVKLRKLHTIVC